MIPARHKRQSMKTLGKKSKKRNGVAVLVGLLLLVVGTLVYSGGSAKADYSSSLLTMSTAYESSVSSGTTSKAADNSDTTSTTSTSTLPTPTSMNPKHPLWRPLPPGSTDVEIAPGVRFPLVTGGNSGQSLWLQRGGRSLDTAFRYGDRAQSTVGRAFHQSGLPRKEVFITTKVMCCPTSRRPEFCTPEHMSKTGRGNDKLVHDPSKQLTKSLRLLNMTYVDMVLLHMPCETPDLTLQAWKMLEREVAAGRTRAIGVSNFNATNLQTLVEDATIKPATNQVMFSIAGHPKTKNVDNTKMLFGSPLYGSDHATLEVCRKHGITLYAYSPLGGSSKINVLGHPIVTSIARARNYTPAQVALRWAVQQGVPVVTSSNNPQHVDQVLAVPHIELSEDEMDRLEAAEQ